MWKFRVWLLMVVIIAMITPTGALGVRDARHVLFSSRWYLRVQESSYASIKTLPFRQF